MSDSLQFVSSLGTVSESIPDLHKIVPGSHADCILKESLRPVGKYDTRPTQVKEPFSLLTSFPDILPPSGQILLSRAEAILTRGEFLMLRGLGSHVTKLPLKGEYSKRFDQILRALADAAPPIIYHRLLDYNPKEFDFLDSDLNKRNLRGCGRLLADEELLHHELNVIMQLVRKGKVVRVVLPFVASPDEQYKIQKVISDLGVDEVGVMVERIRHAEQFKDYPPVDFVIPGPADLTMDLLGGARADFYQSDKAAQRKVIEITQELANYLATANSKAYFIGVKFLINAIHNPGPPHFIRAAYMPHQFFQ